MIQARFGLTRRPFDKSIATADLYRLATVTVLDAYSQLNRALGGGVARSKSRLFAEIQRGIAELTAHHRAVCFCRCLRLPRSRRS